MKNFSRCENNEVRPEVVDVENRAPVGGVGVGCFVVLVCWAALSSAYPFLIGESYILGSCTAVSPASLHVGSTEIDDRFERAMSARCTG